MADADAETRGSSNPDKQQLPAGVRQVWVIFSDLSDARVTVLSEEWGPVKSTLHLNRETAAEFIRGAFRGV
eukprot:9497480-Pyramimonas_sp.AAC.1